MENNKASMTRRLQELEFALQEVTLFLDTHPTDRQALAYRREKLPQLNALKKQYEERFGPLCSLAHQPEGWRWIDGPWPWE